MTPFKMVLRCFALLTLFCGISNFASAQLVVFSTPTTVPTATVCPGATNVALYAFQLNVIGADGDLTAVTFSNTGTAVVPGDIIQYQLRVGSAGGTLIASSTTTTFTGFTHTIAAGVTEELWITANIAASPTANRTISVAQMANTDVTITGFKVGNGNVTGGTKRIITVPAAIGGAATICEGASVTLTQSAIGGTWFSSNTAVATVLQTGQVTGASIANSGSATISYSNGCGAPATAVIPVNAIPNPTITGITSICSGTSTTLGNTVTGGTWTSSTPSVATAIAATGVIGGDQAGTSTITYSNGCGTDPTTVVNVTANVTGISGSSLVCVSSVTPLSNAIAGGTWSSSNTTIASVNLNTGVVTANTVGNVTISYSNGCGTATHPFTVTSTDPGTISGASDVCVGSSTPLSDNISLGVWSSSATGIATVSPSGVVFGAGPGTATITYTISNICGSDFTTHAVTVANPLNAGTIIGPSTMCAGTFVVMSDAVPGGVWSASNGNASVLPTGLVTAISPGSVTISYTLTNVCGPSAATRPLTIFPVLNAGTISGTDNVCVGNTVQLSNDIVGGVWSSTNTAVATINGLGVVTGLSGGVTTISYLMISGCGSLAATYSFTVNPTPDPGTITGPSAVCTGTFALLTDAVAGGVWSSSNTAVATVSGGLVEGVTVGTVTISYTVTNVCGTLSATHPMTVSLPPNAGTITGPASVCVASTIALANAAPGGVWSADNANATVSPLGVVTGVAAGTVNISYTSTTACGTQATGYAITVNPLADAGAISGAGAVCEGAVISLTDPVSGGVWTSSNTGIATVDVNGNVTGVLAGSAVISYAVTNICNTATATHNVTVNPLPAIALITGSSTVCIGSSVIISNATPGGIWSSSDPTVSVLAIGSGIQVTGVSAGPAVITYAVTNGFGCTSTTLFNMTVNSLPVGTPVTGSATACVGLTNTLANATSGGVWASSNTAIATIDPVSGDVTGVATGGVTISYTITNLAGCSVTEIFPVTVNTIPALTPVTGVTTVCVGGVTTLSNSVAGGTWSTTSGNATVSPTGDVTGLTAGTDNIIYTVSNACGSVNNPALVTINPLPFVGPITALYTSVCMGETVALNQAATGGFWSSSNTAVATVDANGIVTPVATGSTGISYTVTNGFGCVNFATLAITVGPAISPVAIAPGPAATLCQGNPVNLRAASTTGGLTYQWVIGNTPIPGAVDSVYSATTAATYSVIIDNGVCSVMRSTVISLSPNPVILFTAPNILYTGSFNSYQWYFNGSLIPGATSSLISTMGNGAYTVVVADANGCTDTSAVYTIGTTGINNTAATQNIKIYPNPVSSVLHIEAAVKVNIAVMSFDGKLLLSQKDAADIDVRGLANGMYMIMVYDENNTLITTAKFAKSE